MIIVSNSTPLIGLSAIGLFDLIESLFGVIIIPEEVYAEVVIRGHGQPGSQEVAAAAWITSCAVSDQKMVAQLMATRKLQRGESEAIALAIELYATRILLDEKPARRYAEANNLLVIGTVGILLLAKSQSFITSVKPHLDALKLAGIRIGKTVYDGALRSAGE